MSMFRILVVDDEEDVRTVERLALSRKFEVVEACDGLDALEKIERAEPDFVILDVSMPLMDGFETCRAIRNNPKFQKVPVLFLSVKGEKEMIKKGYGAGANLYLTKPFDPDRLVKNIEYYFEENRARPSAKTHSLFELRRMEPTGPRKAKEPRRPAAKPSPPKAERAPQPPPPQAEAPPAAAEPEPERPRIMLVDDDTDILEVIAISLGDRFELTTATDGIEAVEKIVLYQPDIIILDAMLPKMSGYQLCASLRRNENYRDTPIIFVSAKTSERDQDYCRRLGANDFVPKPFDPQLLVQKIQSFFDQPDFAIRPKKLTIDQIHTRERAHLDWAEERLEDSERRRSARRLSRFVERKMPP
jgi:DNA-binding response OmpR family regulator